MGRSPPTFGWRLNYGGGPDAMHRGSAAPPQEPAALGPTLAPGLRLGRWAAGQLGVGRSASAVGRACRSRPGTRPLGTSEGCALKPGGAVQRVVYSFVCLLCSFCPRIQATSGRGQCPPRASEAPPCHSGLRRQTLPPGQVSCQGLSLPRWPGWQRAECPGLQLRPHSPQSPLWPRRRRRSVSPAGLPGWVLRVLRTGQSREGLWRGPCAAGPQQWAQEPGEPAPACWGLGGPLPRPHRPGVGVGVAGPFLATAASGTPLM